MLNDKLKCLKVLPTDYYTTFKELEGGGCVAKARAKAEAKANKYCTKPMTMSTRAKLQLKQGKQPSKSMLIVSMLLSGHNTQLLLLITCMLSPVVVFAFNNSSTLQQPVDQQSVTFLDPTCRWNVNETPSDAERLIYILKCDVQPLKMSFEQLMAASNGPKQLLSRTDVDSMINVDKSESSVRIWNEYINLDSTIKQFFADAQYALKRKDFCTYPSIVRFKQLKTYVLNGELLANLYDLIVTEYHTYCLNEALRRLPKIPKIVSDVVDIYIDGTSSNLAENLIRLPGFGDEKKDEFHFDVEAAIEKNGSLENVVNLIMDVSLSSSPKERVNEFKSACKGFLYEIEERWQSMEMMNKMLATNVNGIREYNNFVMRALIPTKYADVCSQLSTIS